MSNSENIQQQKKQTESKPLLDLYLNKLQEAIKDPSRANEVDFLKRRITFLEKKVAEETYLKLPLEEPDEIFCPRCISRYNVKKKLRSHIPKGKGGYADYFWFYCNNCKLNFPNIKKNAELFPIPEPKLSLKKIQEVMSPEIPKDFVCYCHRLCKCDEHPGFKHYVCRYYQCDIIVNVYGPNASSFNKIKELRVINDLKRYFCNNHYSPPMKKLRVNP